MTIYLLKLLAASYLHKKPSYCLEINAKCHGEPFRPVTDLQPHQSSVKLSTYLLTALKQSKRLSYR